MLSFIHFWPVPDPDKTYQDIVYSESDIVIEEVQVTTQRNSPPPPPTPQVPVPVPNDEVIEEDIIVLEEMNDLNLPDPMSLEGVGTLGDEGKISANPQKPPNLVRIVEPTVPEEAKKANIKAEIWVSFLVSKEGTVEEATISQIRLYEGGKDSYKVVDSIGYGIAQATLEAALKWKFRPATDEGEPVRAYTKHIFTYGF